MPARTMQDAASAKRSRRAGINSNDPPSGLPFGGICEANWIPTGAFISNTGFNTPGDRRPHAVCSARSLPLKARP